MNVNFGLLPELGERIKDKKLKKQAISERALQSIAVFKAQL